MIMLTSAVQLTSLFPFHAQALPVDTAHAKNNSCLLGEHYEQLEVSTTAYNISAFQLIKYFFYVQALPGDTVSTPNRRRE